MPSAKPRVSRGNQLVTARPVAVLMLAPNAPAIASSRTSMAKSGAYADAASAALAPSRPTAPVTRSPT